ncbi:peptidase C65 Otubain-domain-containing protein [Rhypophila decipiens]|uniref:ubiquitinyl hydrolase 1 n=1 Tax=Rhypophila decipiens TaxID=261697 RepID=A0AAN6YH01_9PEZI|nr:peptidase C65 Otubain-domain-containing protein [Rhypophila decipiens]
MFQPEPTAYIPLSTGYGIGHGLPEYTFQETPLGFGDSGGGGGPGSHGGGGGGIGSHGCGGGGGFVGTGGSGTVGAGTGAGAITAATAPLPLIYTTPIFNPNTATIGPASGPFSFSTTSSHHNQQHHHHSSHNSSRIKMEPNADDLAAQEAAAREYQPQPQGPLVGEKLPSTAITDEYAKADPIYVQKTMALPQTYSHYRPIQGDGSCGWRAIGFGYFETLITSCDKAQVEAEKLRMTRLNDYIETVGGMSPYIFLDMSEETIELLGRISDALPDRARAMAELMEAFNNPDISNSIIYHLRLLASSWLRGHSEDYSNFIEEGLGVDGYCETKIQQVNREIEHVGIDLLVNVLLKPVGFVLEIAYLDRSPGSQVNHFRFPSEANHQHPSALGPMIHLLFRPDHYDILYPPQMDIQVHRVNTFQPSFMASPVGIPDYSSPDLQTLSSLIPGFGGPPPGLAPFVDATAGSPLTSYTSSPGSTWMPSPFTETAQAQAAPVPVAVPAPTPALTYHLRLSEYCQMPEYVENVTSREPAFQTSTFRNSHFNVAHYNNPNFQPEEYKPESDECDLPPTKASGRKRGSV